jgi:mRNA-degrading endonuclease toxin of MazEF toxin-antitoxin module
VLVLYVPEDEDARSLMIVAPLTSQIRSRRGEVDLGKPRWLPKPSAVNVQGLASFDPGCLLRRLGVLGVSDISRVKNALRDLLNV